MSHVATFTFDYEINLGLLRCFALELMILNAKFVFFEFRFLFYLFVRKLIFHLVGYSSFVDSPKWSSLSLLPVPGYSFVCIGICIIRHWAVQCHSGGPFLLSAVTIYLGPFLYT